MKVFAVVLVVMALVIGIVPAFNNCDYQGKALTLESGKQVPMKCLWTARAEMAMAVPLFGLGAFTAVSRRKESKRALYGVGVLMGAFVMLLPTKLIGVCSSPDMTCNLVTKPTMLFAGGLVIVASFVGLVISEARSKV